MPGFGRVGGIDDPVPRTEYGDDRAGVRNEAEAERDDRREQLLDLPNELRGEVRSHYGGEMGTSGFVRRLRSIANELERHADAIEACDEDSESQ